MRWLSLFVLVFLLSFSLALALPHAQYGQFSRSEGRFVLADDLFVVSDDLVYHRAYYSVAGGDWQPLSLTGAAHRGSSRWLSGSSSASLPGFGDGEHYVIAYTCSRGSRAWDCHDGRWQLEVITQDENPSHLLRQWNFENGPGGTLHGAFITQDSSRGNVLRLDGVNDYLDIGSFSVPGDEVTIAAWFNINQLPSDNDPRIVVKGETQDYQDWALLINRGGYPQFRYHHGYLVNEGRVHNENVLITTNNWHHIAGVFSHGEGMLYYDGVLVATQSIAGNPGVNNHAVWIGGQPPDATNRPFPGFIDDVKIFNRSLSASEIDSLANPGCNTDSDCPEDASGNAYCSQGDVYRNYFMWTCVNGNCEKSTTSNRVEDCTYTCTNNACCTPNTNECGSDGCGSSHSDCQDGYDCVSGVCEEQLAPSDPDILRVSANGHFLVTGNEEPFFYLGDTAWNLLTRLEKSEIDSYLQTRKNQGFTVIMIVGHGLFPDVSNAYGYYPYASGNWNNPRVVAGADNDYWDLFDYVVAKTKDMGLYLAVVPIWGNRYYSGIDTSTAANIGTFYGERYGQESHLVWIMGGDVRADGNEELATAMAEALTQAALGSKYDFNEEIFITYHPPGWYEAQGYKHSSSYFIHDEHWLDANGIQSGHYDADIPPLRNYLYVEHDYAMTPAKPTMEMESLYEAHYFKNSESRHRGDDHDVRRNAYWSVLAGAHGYTYGNSHIFPFYTSDMGDTKWHCDTEWTQSVYDTGAQDMQHLKELMLSRPYLSRIPDQNLITSSNNDDIYRVQAARASDGSYAFIYNPDRDAKSSVTVDVSRLSGNTLRAWWFNPRTGAVTDGGTVSRSGTRSFFMPSGGPDWVLVLDDASKGFSSPGQ